MALVSGRDRWQAAPEALVDNNRTADSNKHDATQNVNTNARRKCVRATHARLAHTRTTHFHNKYAMAGVRANVSYYKMGAISKSAIIYELSRQI